MHRPRKSLHGSDCVKRKKSHKNSRDEVNQKSKLKKANRNIDYKIFVINLKYKILMTFCILN